MKLPYVNLFLGSLSSQKTKKLYQQRLNVFTDYFSEKKIEDFEDKNITIEITKFFQEVVEKEKVTAKTKKKWVGLISNYFDFLVQNQVLEKNPVNTNQTFTDHVDPSIIKRRMKPNLSLKDVYRLLNHAKLVNHRMYIIISLLVQTGGRSSEIRSIRIENVDLDQRLIITGVEEDHKKSGLCYYFIQESFVPILGNYINNLKSTYRNVTFLFMSSSKAGFISGNSVRSNLRKYAKILDIKSKTNPHAFRHFLNNQRLRMGCNDSVMAILLNQQPKGTNAQYYLQFLRDIESRREFYDKFTPMFEF